MRTSSERHERRDEEHEKHEKHEKHERIIEGHGRRLLCAATRVFSKIINSSS